MCSSQSTSPASSASPCNAANTRCHTPAATQR
jgi:hypothetical protein